MTNTNKKKVPKKKVLIALSGGIDSAVSAYLLIKQGYDVEAAFMKNWTSTAGLLKNECPWLIDRQDALRVAAFLRIPLHTLDFEKQYRDRVMKYFFDEYKKGRTPNPDVMCNKEIKFKLLYDWAIKNGFDCMATGHYAQVHESRNMKHGAEQSILHVSSFMLHRSIDEFKDQTYFIYNIKTEQLPHLVFPIGGMKKSAVRTLARKLNLPNAEKKESMGLCFVGKIRLKDFLEQKLKPKSGKIIDQDGKIIGQHPGLFNYTIGQRQGINIGANGPYYVTKKDLKTNALYVTNDANDKSLMTKEVQIHSVNWLGELISRPADQPASLLGRFRHQGELVPLTIGKISADNYRVIFKKSQKAIASGQSLVIYKGKICLGGGIIA
ncbi:MAG: tRNA 2-thiouridine(34) synthase MnmA [Legionella sp.]|uniref:tRNA 2-thiouridine(34) synthase MnmA n=1 Tax=Legionella sp. TaxID=459 RepID=UPI00283DE689|nr:tRNA 2-thiouridine(34) synthase MnmA [Legionella sp.]